MASEKLANIEPWDFRSPFTDTWFSETFSRETETFTKALQQSISTNNHTNSNSKFNSDDVFDSISLFLNPETAPSTPAISNVTGSDYETAKKRDRNGIPLSTNNGKVSKRKSRASKRKSQTTFINADPANFRQMVQQVTGVRLGNSQVSMESIFMPEPQRIGNRLTNFGMGGCLPTLDTSAFLLDHNNNQAQQNVTVGPTATDTSASGGTQQNVEVGPVGYDAGGVELVDFDSLSSSFPTLESWKLETHVMENNIYNSN